jgi:hypothetical protein
LLVGTARTEDARTARAKKEAATMVTEGGWEGVWGAKEVLEPEFQWLLAQALYTAAVARRDIAVEWRDSGGRAGMLPS